MVYNFRYFCSLYNSLHTRGAVQNVVNSKNTTGTAVTTMKDCKAFTLPSPIDTSTTATNPIRTAKIALKDFGGSPSPEIAMEIVSDIESVVVKTKITVANKNNAPN